MGQLCLFVQYKLFMFKDEWNIFSDCTATHSLVKVKAREAVALNITRDILDAASGAVFGRFDPKG